MFKIELLDAKEGINLSGSYHILDTNQSIRWIVQDTDPNKIVTEYGYEIEARLKAINKCEELLKEHRFRKLANLLEDISEYTSIIDLTERDRLTTILFHLKELRMVMPKRRYTRAINAINSMLYIRSINFKGVIC